MSNDYISGWFNDSKKILFFFSLFLFFNGTSAFAAKGDCGNYKEVLSRDNVQMKDAMEAFRCILLDRKYSDETTGAIQGCAQRTPAILQRRAGKGPSEYKSQYYKYSLDLKKYILDPPDLDKCYWFSNPKEDGQKIADVVEAFGLYEDKWNIKTCDHKVAIDQNIIKPRDASGKLLKPPVVNLTPSLRNRIIQTCSLQAKDEFAVELNRIRKQFDAMAGKTRQVLRKAPKGCKKSRNLLRALDIEDEKLKAYEGVLNDGYFKNICKFFESGSEETYRGVVQILNPAKDLIVNWEDSPVAPAANHPVSGTAK